jgi:hypothetical protein
MTDREVTLLKDFITWQSLPFVDNVFSTTDETIKHFNEWLIQMNKNQQSSEDCISRAYIKPIIKELEYDQIDNDYALSLLSDIKNAPSVTPERPKGKWIKTEGSFRCSECLIFPEYIRTLNYCPSCGSYNGGEENEDGKSL